eukprot:gene32201-16749_t
MLTKTATDANGKPRKKRNELKESLMLAIPTIFDLIATVLMNVGLLYVTASVYHSPRKKRNELKESLMLAIPTIFDLIATVLMNVGLLYVTASVYQMMRGAEMLFAAGMAVTFLKRKLNKYHYYGLICCVTGIALVGSSSIMSGDGSATQVISQEQMLVGMGLIVVSQAVQAAQLTFEDFFMADMNIAPMKIVGFEGFFGTIFVLGIFMPIAYFSPGVEGEGFHEDIVDTLTMIGNSRTLIIILAVDMVALLLYNVSGMMVTGHMGAVFRTVLETMRTLFVWLMAGFVVLVTGTLVYGKLLYGPLTFNVDLALFYGGFGLGEKWSVWSWLQMAGFVVLVTGTLVYGKGDEEGLRLELEEAMVAQAAVEPIAAEDWRGSVVESIAAEDWRGAGEWGEREEGDGDMWEEAMVAQVAVEPIAAEDWRGSCARPTTVPVAMPASSSVAMPMSSVNTGSYMATHPVGSLTGSFRATQTIMAGSYSRSIGNTRGLVPPPYADRDEYE